MAPAHCAGHHAKASKDCSERPQQAAGDAGWQSKAASDECQADQRRVSKLVRNVSMANSLEVSLFLLLMVGLRSASMGRS
jgi:hypothetical protein